MQSQDPEPYFILPVKKQPIMMVPGALWMKCALVAICMLIAVMLALALGMWWDRNSIGLVIPAAGNAVLRHCLTIAVS